MKDTKVTQRLSECSEQRLFNSASHWKHLGMFEHRKHLLPTSLAHMSWFNGWGADIRKNLTGDARVFFSGSGFMCLEGQAL